MASSGGHEAHAAAHGPAGGKPVAILEALDNWAHIVVAVFFILMAGTVIVHMGFIFMQQFPLIVPGSTVSVGSQEASAAPGSEATAEGTTKAEHATERISPFARNSLDLLSNILFVVILLELLRTIITYLQTHNIEAIMREFLVVGIISSVRKILLVGAEASLTGSKGVDFIQEASGVVIDIIGILLLIYGLVMLRRVFGAKPTAAAHEA